MNQNGSTVTTNLGIIHDNEGTIDTGVFTGTDVNNGIVTGNATFGTVDGSDTASNSGSVGGNATFYAHTTNSGTVGSADVYFPVSLPLGGTVTGATNYHNYSVSGAIYYINNKDNNWDTIANWYTDSDHTIPAGTIPVEGNIVYIDGQMDNGPSTEVALDHIYVGYINGGSFGVDITKAVGVTDFYDSTVNNGTISGGSTVTFHDNSSNSGSGAITGGDTATVWKDSSINYGSLPSFENDFYNSSQNQGTIPDGFTTFSDNSANVGAGTIAGSVTFYNQSANGGTIDSGVFKDSSSDYFSSDYWGNQGGTVTGDAYFYNNSSVGGWGSQIGGTAYFHDTSSNGGGIGDANFYDQSNCNGYSSTPNFYDDSTNNCEVGTVSFHNNSHNGSGSGPVGDATFYDASVNDANTYISGLATFNDDSVNNGTVQTATFGGATDIIQNHGTVYENVSGSNLFYNGDDGTVYTNDAGANIEYQDGYGKDNQGSIYEISHNSEWLYNDSNGGTIDHIYPGSNLDENGGSLVTNMGTVGTNDGGATITNNGDGGSYPGTVTTNLGTVHDNEGTIDAGVFTGTDVNGINGIITGDATFGVDQGTDTAYNSGSIGGNATFYANTANHDGNGTGGQVTGTADVYYPVDRQNFGGTVTGGITYHNYPKVDNLYFLDKQSTHDYKWDTVANWWSDSNTPLGYIPLGDGTETIYINGEMDAGPSAPDKTFAHIYVGGGAGGFTADFTGASGDATFSDATKNMGTVSGNAVFIGGSSNQYIVDGNATFGAQAGPSYTENSGIVTGDAIFYGASYNSHSGGVYGTATFYGDSVNGDGVGVKHAIFYDESRNNQSNTPIDSATFNDSSSNDGTVSNATFNGSSVNENQNGNAGTVVNSATFGGISYTIDQVGNADGATVTFTTPQTFTIDGATFNQDASNWTNANFIFENGAALGYTIDHGAVKYATFLDTSANNGSVTGDAIFGTPDGDDTAYNAGNVMGNATFYAYTANTDPTLQILGKVGTNLSNKVDIYSPVLLPLGGTIKGTITYHDYPTPEITITGPDNYSTSSQTISASTTAGILTMANTTDGTCTADSGLTFGDYIDQTFTYLDANNTPTNGTAVCYKADYAGITTYKLSNPVGGIVETCSPDKDCSNVDDRCYDGICINAISGGSGSTTNGWVQTSPSNSTSVVALWTIDTPANLINQEIQFYSDGSCTPAKALDGLINLSSPTATTESFTTGTNGNTYTYKIFSIFSNSDPIVSPCSSAMTIAVPPTLAITFPVASTTYNATTWAAGPFSWTCADASGCNISTCEVYDNSNTDLGSCYSNETSFTPAADGNYTIYIKEQSNLGITGTSGTISFTYDTTAPTITITGPDVTNKSSQSISASINNGTLEMSNTTGSTCNATLNFSSYAKQTFTSTSDNGTKVCYKAFDAVGNTAYSLSDAVAGITVETPVNQNPGGGGGGSGSGIIFYTINAYAGVNGSISPAGFTTTAYGSKITYTITPANGYYVEDVLVDGVSKGAITTYTFNNVAGNHTISVTFLAGNQTSESIPQATLNYISDALNQIRLSILNLFGNKSIKPTTNPPTNLQPAQPPVDQSQVNSENKQALVNMCQRLIKVVNGLFNLLLGK